MSGNIDDLKFSLSVDFGNSLEGIRNVDAALKQTKFAMADIVPAASQMTSAVKAIQWQSPTLAAEGFTTLATSTEYAANVMDTLSVAADAVDASVTALAFSTEAAAGTLNAAGKAAGYVTASLQSIVPSSKSAAASLTAATTTTTVLATAANGASTATRGVAAAMHSAAGFARLFATAASGAGSILSAVAGAISHVAHTIHAALLVGDLLTTAFMMMLAPLKAVWAVGSAAFSGLAMIMNTVLLPVKLLWAGFSLLAKTVWSVVSPILSLGLAAAKVWFIFKGWVGAVKIIGTWLGMLPPKLRLVVGGMLALGAAGKVGAVGMKAIGVAVGVAAKAATIAISGFRLLSLPILALTNPAAAARNAMLLLGTSMRAAGGAALWTAGKIATLASATAKLATAPLSMAVDGLKSMGGTLLRLGPQMAAVGAIAAVAFGTKMAMAVEKNQAVFGTMVHDMEQGKAIVASIQNTTAAGLFDNQELLDSSRLLFKGGVAAVDLAAKTDQLAKIAAGTSTEIGDLARIYQQGANSGSFGQDKINQLAERGIAIYEGLTAATGKSGGELSDMISSGKIGVAEMDAALAHLTEGQGYYANSLRDIGSTTSGMMSQIKNNILQALGTVMGAGTEASKPFLTMLVGWSESVKTGIGAVMPVVNQFVSTIKAVFTGLWSVVSAVFGGIFSGASVTFGGILSVVMDWVTKFRWFFENLLPITQFAFTSIGLGAVTMFNDIAYFLTDTLPAYAMWFGDNFVNIFRDMFNATVTIFGNLGTNIRNAMVAIWDYIKSGGTADLELTWTPLLEGFQSTVAALPDVPERAMTELERSMQAHAEQLGTNLANSFDAMQMEAQAALSVEAPTMPEINPDLKTGGTGEGGQSGAGDQRSSFVVNSLERGSQAALDAIFGAQKDKTADKQLNEAKQANKHLAKIANKPEPMVLGPVAT